VADLDVHALEADYAVLEARGRADLEAEGFPAEDVWTTRTADLRYAGQAYELNVDAPGRIDDAEALEAIADAFRGEHTRLYGHAPDQPLELVNLRVQAWARVAKPDFAAIGLPTAEPKPPGTRRVYLEGVEQEVAVHDRDALVIGDEVTGPAILEQADCTTALLAGDTARVDQLGNLVISVGIA
jgi:N-methylhydantoinase A